MIGIFLLSTFLIDWIACRNDHVKEIGFKFWLNPGVKECYHELLEKGSTLYFMFEILNQHNDGDNLIAYFRNANNGSIVSIIKSSDRGHLEFATNETVSIDICIDHEQSYTYVKYLSVFFHVYYIERVLEKIKNVEEFDNSSSNARNSINSIVENVIVTREHQIELQMLNQKDLFLIEKNSLWIDRWAMIHILILLSCCLFQTYFIKRLFQSSRK